MVTDSDPSAAEFPGHLRPSAASRLRIWVSDSSPLPRSVPVTVVILTMNEAVNIERCLRSVDWARQVLVVDSGSSDDTVAIAEGMGATVVHHPFIGFGAQRQWALDCGHLIYDWVLWLDADEWASADLAHAVAEVVAEPRHVAYIARVRVVFQGRWIRHAGWYRGLLPVRLFDRRSATIRGDYSERVEVEGSIGFLTADIVDEDRKPFAAWLAKHNVYSTVRARLIAELREEPLGLRLRRALVTRPRRRILREVIKQVVLPHMPMSALGVFVYLYIVRGGILDGRVGLRFCALHAFQQLAVVIKTDETARANLGGETDTI